MVCTPVIIGGSFHARGEIGSIDGWSDAKSEVGLDYATQEVDNRRRPPYDGAMNVGLQTIPAPAAPELPELAALWNWNDPAASERAFREAAAAARDAGAHAYEAEAWTQVARAQGLQGHFDAAHATLAATEALPGAAEPIPRVRWNLEKGRVLRSSGHPDEAKRYFLIAWDLANTAGVINTAGAIPLALDAAHMVALVEPPDEALAWAWRAIGVAEAASDPRARGWLGPLYNNTGWTLFELGEHEQALDLWQKGVAVRIELGQTGQTIHIGWWTVARGLRALGRHDEALAILERLQAEGAAAGQPDGYVHEELAENLLALGRSGEAREQFSRAYALLRDDRDVAGDAARLERLRTGAG